MNKSRQQFENYCTDSGLSIEIVSGIYNWNNTRIAWEAWKASRESLEVELPRGHDEDDEYDYFAIGYNSAIDRIKSVLGETGVKIK